MDKDTFQSIREAVDQKIEYWQSIAQRSNQQAWIEVRAPSEPFPTRYEVLQVALLFRILDTLESIDSSLNTLGNDWWRRNNP